MLVQDTPMKRILLCLVAMAAVAGSEARAADMRMRAPVLKAPPMAAAYNWSGCYLGAHIGGGWSEKDWDYENGSTRIDIGKQNLDGVLGGGQIGCNVQNGAIVYGIEGDVSWSGIKDKNWAPLDNDARFDTKVEWLGTLTGRVGYAWDGFLLYVKGGAAFARDTYDESYHGDFLTAQGTRWGWTVGGGLEFAVAGNWTAKLEYNYIDLGTDVVALRGTSDSFDDDVRQTIQAVKFGLNYRFGDSPVTARY
jgi:outer membrane immunogenic protein